MEVKPFQQDDIRLSLHVITDPSSRTYAAAAYLREADTEGRVVVNLVTGYINSRLGPQDGEKIPRLEILRALIASRILKSLREEYDGVLKIEEIL